MTRHFRNGTHLSSYDHFPLDANKLQPQLYQTPGPLRLHGQSYRHDARVASVSPAA